jgi:hypothetical protein
MRFPPPSIRRPWFLGTAVYLLLGLVVGPFLFPQHPALKTAYLLVGLPLIIVLVGQMRRFND